MVKFLCIQTLFLRNVKVSCFIDYEDLCFVPLSPNDLSLSHFAGKFIRKIAFLRFSNMKVLTKNLNFLGFFYFQTMWDFCQ